MFPYKAEVTEPPFSADGKTTMIDYVPLPKASKIFRGIIKNRAKDGTPYYVDAMIAPIMGENGKPKKYLGVRYDITEAEIERQNARGVLGAIDASYAYIEFDLTGHMLRANKNFLDLMGYQIDEIRGKHHRLFVDPVQSASPAYQQFWRDLNAGNPQSAVFKRITKAGQEVPRPARKCGSRRSIRR